MSGLKMNNARLARRWLAVFAVGLLPGAVLAHDITPRPEMSVVLDRSSFGKTIKNGRYDYAIEKLTAPGRSLRRQHLDRINLCVAYTKSGHLALAEEVCDSALLLVRNKLAGEADDFARAELARFEAVALSNRGVVRIAAGDFEAAERDFRDALKVSRAAPAAERNLAYLELQRARD